MDLARPDLHRSRVAKGTPAHTLPACHRQLALVSSGDMLEMLQDTSIAVLGCAAPMLNEVLMVEARCVHRRHDTIQNLMLNLSHWSKSLPPKYTKLRRPCVRAHCLTSSDDRAASAVQDRSSASCQASCFIACCVQMCSKSQKLGNCAIWAKQWLTVSYDGGFPHAQWAEHWNCVVTGIRVENSTLSTLTTRLMTAQSEHAPS